MKKLLSLVIVFLTAMPLFAALNTMNYQAVISNPDGTAAANREIGMKFAIIADGVYYYTEECSLTTNAEGLAEHEIGSLTLGGLSYIDWTIPGIYLEVGVDLNGGTNYTTTYNSTIQAVPTAMYAEKSGDSKELWDYSYDLRDYVDKVYGSVEDNRGQIWKLEDDMNRHVDNLWHGVDDLSRQIEKLETGMTDAIKADLDELRHRILVNTDSIAILTEKIANLGTGGGSDIDKAELESTLKYLEDNFMHNRWLIEELQLRLNEMSSFWVDKSEFIEEMYRIDNSLASVEASSKASIAMVEAKIAEISHLQNQMQELIYAEIANMEALLDAAIKDLQAHTQALIAETAAMVDAKIDAEVKDLKTRIEEMAKGLIADYSGLLQDELTKLKDEMKAYVEGYLKEYMEQYMGGIQDSITELSKTNMNLKQDIHAISANVESLEGRINYVDSRLSDTDSLARFHDDQIKELVQENADLKGQIADLMNVVNALQQKVEELSK